MKKNWNNNDKRMLNDAVQMASSYNKRNVAQFLIGLETRIKCGYPALIKVYQVSTLIGAKNIAIDGLKTHAERIKAIIDCIKEIFDEEFDPMTGSNLDDVIDEIAYNEQEPKQHIYKLFNDSVKELLKEGEAEFFDYSYKLEYFNPTMSE